MAKRVLFKFRAEESDQGVHLIFGLGHGDYTACGPIFCAVRPGRGQHTAETRDRRRRRRQPGAAGRETLDFFEQLYEELYGEGASSQAPDWI